MKINNLYVSCFKCENALFIIEVMLFSMFYQPNGLYSINEDARNTTRNTPVHAEWSKEDVDFVHIIYQDMLRYGAVFLPWYF